MEFQETAVDGGAVDQRPWLDRVATLNSDNVKALRALVQRIRDGEGVFAEETRRTLEAVSEDAKAHGVRAEHLLITVKEIWNSAPGATSRISRDSFGTTAMDRFVSTLLDVYYGVPSCTS